MLRPFISQFNRHLIRALYIAELYFTPVTLNWRVVLQYLHFHRLIVSKVIISLCWSVPRLGFNKLTPSLFICCYFHAIEIIFITELPGASKLIFFFFVFRPATDKCWWKTPRNVTSAFIFSWLLALDFIAIKFHDFCIAEIRYIYIYICARNRK